MFLTSKLRTFFIDNFTSGWNLSQLLIYKVGVKIHIGFWALKDKCTQYGFCGQGNLQEWWKGNFFFEVGRDKATFFWSSSNFLFEDCPMVVGCDPGPYPIMKPLPLKACGGRVSIHPLIGVSQIPYMCLHEYGRHRYLADRTRKQYFIVKLYCWDVLKDLVE